MNTSLRRREFLKCGISALAVAALRPAAIPAEEQAAPAPPKRRDLKKGYMLSTLPSKKEFAVLDQFKMLKGAGFEGVEVRSHADRAEVLDARDATGLAVPSVVAGQQTRSLSSPNPAERARGVEGLQHALRDAKAYGASSVLTVAGGVNEKTSYADAYARTQEEIRKAVPLAEELGFKLAIENVWNHFLLSPLEAARYVDEFNSPAVGWHFDIGNVIWCGWPEHWIRALGHRIQQLHIKEFSREKQNKEGVRKGFQVDYLEGDNDWPAIMKAVDEIGYRGWAIIECPWHPPGVPTAERLSQISGKLDRILGM